MGDLIDTHLRFRYTTMDDIVKTVFSRKGAKNAKKRFININELLLHALREILTFCETVNSNRFKKANDKSERESYDRYSCCNTLPVGRCTP